MCSLCFLNIPLVICSFLITENTIKVIWTLILDSIAGEKQYSGTQQRPLNRTLFRGRLLANLQPAYCYTQSRNDFIHMGTTLFTWERLYFRSTKPCSPTIKLWTQMHYFASKKGLIGRNKVVDWYKITSITILRGKQ